MNSKCVSMLLLLALLFAATTNHVAEAVISAPEPSTPRDNGQGWYFSEFSIRVGTNPGPGTNARISMRCFCIKNIHEDVSPIRATMPVYFGVSRAPPRAWPRDKMCLSHVELGSVTNVYHDS